MSSSYRVGRVTQRSDNKITGSRYRSKSLDDTYKRSAGYGGTSSICRSNTLDGKYGSSNYGSKYLSKSYGAGYSGGTITRSMVGTSGARASSLSRYRSLSSHLHGDAVASGQSRSVSHAAGGHSHSASHIAGGHSHNASRAAGGHSHRVDRIVSTGGNCHSASGAAISSSSTKTSKESSSKGQDLEISAESNSSGKGRYRITGRITRSRSPSPDRRDKLNLPHVGRDSRKESPPPSAHVRRVSGSDGYRRRSGSADDLLASSKRVISDYSVVRSGRSPHRYSRSAGGCSPRGRSPSANNSSYLPRPILKTGFIRDKPHPRSRSMNDSVRRSPSPRRGGTPDGIFPVCSRYPNCSVCTIDIPLNQVNKDIIIHTVQDELKEESEHIAIIEKKDKEIHMKIESIAQITQILEKTKKELEVKVTECTRRTNEVKQLKQELKNVLNEKKRVEHSYSEQKITISKLDVTETRLEQMTSKCDELATDNRELVERIKSLEISEREFIDLERNVIELQTQLRDMEDVEVHRDELFEKLKYVKKQRDEFIQKSKFVEEERDEFVRSNKTLEQYISEWKRKTVEFKKTNQALKDRILSLERDKKEYEVRIVDIQQERTIMQTKIGQIEHERDDYIRELREVTLERNTLEARLADFEDLLGDHDQLEEGFHSLRLKVAELTRHRDDLEMMVASYKGKIQLLKRTLNEREDTIMQLTHDVKTLKIAIDNSAFEDLKVKPIDYVKPQAYNPKAYRPVDIDITSESDSYDIIQSRPYRYETTSDESILETRRIKPERRRHKARKYVALFDYDPYKSSTSEHPERELRLKEGDYVTVYGDMDIDGFLDGEVDGVQGLVPSIYVEETSDSGGDYSSHSQGHRHHHQHYISSSSRERRYVVLYDYDPYTMGTTDRPDLQLSLHKGDVIIVEGDVDSDGYFYAICNGKRGLVPSNFVEEYSSYYSSSRHRGQRNDERYHSGFDGTIVVDEVAGPPYAPSDLKVSRVVTKNAVLLSWLLPPMDEYNRSNGSRISGYRLWVNGKFRQDVKSSTVTKVLIDDVDLHGRVEFSIQTIGENDVCSEKCHFAITGALSALNNDGNTGSNAYVALYDYDPFKSSPNPNPSLELAFQEGDLMTITDTSRSDGFYGAEINGKKGLVPSNFIERISSGGGGSSSSVTHRIHHLSHSSSHIQDSDSNRKVQFKSKEKH